MIKKIIILGMVLLGTNACVPVVVAGGAAIAGKTALDERTAGTTIDDRAIWGRVNGAYLAEKDNHLLFQKISIEVRNGRVMLSGAVPTDENKIHAIKLAWKQKGVKEVISEIKVSKEGSGVGTYAKDTWITTQAKTKLLANKYVRSVNFSVETIDGVVYLFGNARSKEEVDLINELCATVSGVKKVVNYINVN